MLILVSLVLVYFFATYWFYPTHVPNNFSGIPHIFDFLLFALVSYVVWQPIMMAMLLWAISSHIKQHWTPKAPKGLKVAFITTFVPSSESIDLLRKNLPAILNVRYEHDTWVLDEGDDPRVKELCVNLGVKHFSRFGKAHLYQGKYADKTKGGNHNAWYDTYGNDYDIVAQIDTDFAPDPDFLLKTLGHFRDPKVGFVGTPQMYGNTKQSLIARGAAEQTYIFYGPVLRGFHGMDMTLLIGANHIVRVAALKSVNHYTAHITEDMLTGMKLHAHGWKSVYVPEPLAVGEGPITWETYFNQQMRWAYGCIDILFRHSPRFFKMMNWRQKLYYFFLQQYYFFGVAMLLGTIGIGLYTLFGLDTADIDFGIFMLYYIPVVFMTLYVPLWLQRFNVLPEEEKGLLMAGNIICIATWPVFFLALIGVLRKRRLTYKVTPKGFDDDPDKHRVSLRVFVPHICVGLFCLMCLIVAQFTHHNSGLMMFWLLSTMSTMLILPFVETIHGNFRRTHKAVRRSFQLIARVFLRRAKPCQLCGAEALACAHDSLQ